MPPTEPTTPTPSNAGSDDGSPGPARVGEPATSPPRPAADSGVVEQAAGRRASGSEFASAPVAAAVTLLETLPHRPLAEHPDVYQQIHTDLQHALADIDDA